VLKTSGSQPVVHGPLVVHGHLPSGPRGHLPSGPRAKAIYVLAKDINTQTDQFWQFSMTQFSVVVRDRETKFVNGPRVSKG